ncbi:hypothetical protein HFO27_34010 [Rhizobium leguminosarum]|uniref:hypothetical protein n=1 Tax=Rhizobium leguminosarum TaxID=384 RepID=UPI001C90032A|nr:hypothetical protein [Rhizobium leguminosarum]MBY3179527.1 hypothetical protein [Rhizobium leguminosarum]MBY5645453.1 hypothetical protein [Rhizobium leguminosarum]
MSLTLLPAHLCVRPADRNELPAPKTGTTKISPTSDDTSSGTTSRIAAKPGVTPEEALDEIEEKMRRRETEKPPPG